MSPRTKFTPQERQTRSRLTDLLHKEMLLAGSLVTMARTCGKQKCRCQEGRKHVSLYLAIRVGKTRKMIYIPQALEQTVRSWIDAYHRARHLTQSISQDCLQRFLQTKRQHKQRRGPTDRRAKGTPTS